jgi:hypothetical protein
MNGSGHIPASDGQVLCWPRRVLSADDLRRHLTSQRELQLLPRAIVTPLAADELKARGIRVTRQAAMPSEEATVSAGRWGYAQDRPDAAVESVVWALERDGTPMVALPAPSGAPWEWARAIAECIARGECCGGVVFAVDPELVCCVANKVSGLRAAAVATPQAAARARQGLGANLLAVETAGRTFFELRQILRTICGNDAACCPEPVAKALKELDGHAHR